MKAEVSYGRPTWTSGVFGTARAEDDLGVEDVGAGLLRRLLPGIIQNTPNAGYYSFYPYLLWRWEQRSTNPAKTAFVPFYRRQEAVFAAACVLHDHRHDRELLGINGALAAKRHAREIADGAAELDLDRLADEYMKTRLGGYGLFYAVALQDARLVTPGAPGLVDRASELGRDVAAAFAREFEQTTYFRDYFEATGPVPAEVVRELGDAVCLCTIPGRSDHELLLRTFFGEPLASEAWEERRRGRVESLSLFLEFHDQKPDGASDDLAAWRRALAEPRFSDQKVWKTAHGERRHSWRAYQLREIAVLALTAIWSVYLAELAARGRATHAELVSVLRSWLDAGTLGFDRSTPLGDAAKVVGDAVPDAYGLAAAAEPLQWEWRDAPPQALGRALRILFVLPREVAREAPGFTELLDEGGTHRWSLRYVGEWLAARQHQSVAEVAGQLLDALHHQHVRVALTKVRVPSAQNLRREKDPWRDPFCFAEDDGELRPLRGDEPFWSGARYEVVNHLLWTLGLLTSPGSSTRPTDAGRELLAREAERA
jgi:hypothetical protein